MYKYTYIFSPAMFYSFPLEIYFESCWNGQKFTLKNCGMVSVDDLITVVTGWLADSPFTADGMFVQTA